MPRQVQALRVRGPTVAGGALGGELSHLLPVSELSSILFGVRGASRTELTLVCGGRPKSSETVSQSTAFVTYVS